MAEHIDVMSLTQERHNELLQQLRESSKEIATLTTEHASLQNDVATFQMTMNEVFRPLLDKCIIVYLDDILIYSPDRAQHLHDIKTVFKILSENHLLTKASKCEFLQDRLPR
ncbi:unnamed protein product [Closterium sp. NIES-53]